MGVNEGVEGKAVAEALVEVVHVHSGIACKIRVKSRRKRRKKERKEKKKKRRRKGGDCTLCLLLDPKEEGVLG